MWRDWLFCEYGAVPASQSGGGTDWWKRIDAAQRTAMFATPATDGTGAAAPAKCTVPAVLAADGTTVVRPKIEYYGKVADLTTEDTPQPTDGVLTNVTWKKWTAEYNRATAVTAETADSTFQSVSR